MIVWTGRGFLIILIYFLSVFAFLPIFPDTSGYPVVLAAFVTAAFCWYFGCKWNNKTRRIFIDEETGERLEVKNNHSLFWIKMQYWGIISSLFGVSILIKESITVAVIVFILLCALYAYIFIQRRKRNEELREVLFAENSSQTGEEESDDSGEEIEDKEDSSRFIQR